MRPTIVNKRSKLTPPWLAPLQLAANYHLAAGVNAVKLEN